MKSSKHTLIDFLNVKHRFARKTGPTFSQDALVAARQILPQISGHMEIQLDHDAIGIGQEKLVQIHAGNFPHTQLLTGVF